MGHRIFFLFNSCCKWTWVPLWQYNNFGKLFRIQSKLSLQSDLHVRRHIYLWSSWQNPVWSHYSVLDSQNFWELSLENSYYHCCFCLNSLLSRQNYARIHSLEGTYPNSTSLLTFDLKYNTFSFSSLQVKVQKNSERTRSGPLHVEVYCRIICYSLLFFIYFYFFFLMRHERWRSLYTLGLP